MITHAKLCTAIWEAAQDERVNDISTTHSNLEEIMCHPFSLMFLIHKTQAELWPCTTVDGPCMQKPWGSWISISRLLGNCGDSPVRSHVPSNVTLQLVRQEVKSISPVLESGLALDFALARRL